MTTVQESERFSTSQMRNGRRWPADNFFVNVRSLGHEAPFPPGPTGLLGPAMERAASSDERKAQADNTTKNSKSGLEPNLVVSSTKTERDIGRANAALDERYVVYVVDENPHVRLSLQALISFAGWRCELCASAQEFLSKPVIVERSCVLLDFNLSDRTGLDLQRTLPDHLSGMPIVFLTHHANVSIAVEAMKRGAIDFLTRPCDDDVLLAAIRKAFERSQERYKEARATQTISERRATLSRREHEVMTLVVTGLLNKQIGFELGISEITVKAHRGQVMRKMGARSLAGLVTMAGRIGLAAPSW
jgi:FixJ family two-component response regulator